MTAVPPVPPLPIHLALPPGNTLERGENTAMARLLPGLVPDSAMGGRDKKGAWVSANEQTGGGGIRRHPGVAAPPDARTWKVV